MMGAAQHIRQVRLDAEAVLREFRAGDTSNTERLLMRIDMHARQAQVAVADARSHASRAREYLGEDVDG